MCIVCIKTAGIVRFALASTRSVVITNSVVTYCVCVAVHASRSGGETDDDSDDEPSATPPRQYSAKLADLVGKVLLMTQEERKKTVTVPVLVVQPNADSTDLRTREHLLVKSFKDSKL